MITLEEAYQITQSQIVPLSTERVSLDEALGRVLAEDVFSDMEMPPFDKSAVDGYACRMSDMKEDRQPPLILTVIETIPAGIIPVKKIGPGQCSKIMTGAMLPEGSDYVVMIEDTEMHDETKVRVLNRGTARNICCMGEDIKKGDKLLEKGRLLEPQHIAELATAGAAHPLVYRKAEVAVISTGNELVEPYEKPGTSKIRNSNASQLIAQINQTHAKATYYGIVKDDKQSLNEIITGAIEQNDVVIISGGVSMGDFDYVPEVLMNIGVSILFKSISVQPGRPTAFGKINEKFIFGLPGNPVSSFVIFLLLVKPFLLGLMGCKSNSPVIYLPMGKDHTRMKSSRKSLIPVRIINGELFTVEYHGSSHINAYSGADGIISMEIGQTSIKKGELVYVRQI